MSAAVGEGSPTLAAEFGREAILAVAGMAEIRQTGTTLVTELRPITVLALTLDTLHTLSPACRAVLTSKF
jgi:hypothetical protein